MLERGALDRHTHLLRLRGQQLRLRGYHVRPGGHAHTVAILGDFQCEIVGLHRVVEEDLQLILAPELKVIRREIGLRGQACRCERGLIGLRSCFAALHLAPYLAPDIERPVYRAACAVHPAWGRGFLPLRDPPIPAERVGQKPACASRTSALACSTAAAAAFTFWFEMSIWSSSPLNTASLKMCHHGPRLRASAGSVGFQPFSSL